MLNPHPVRIRSQSNPPRPNFKRANSTPAAGDLPSASGSTLTLGLTPKSRPGTAGSTPAQTPQLGFTPLSSAAQQQQQQPYITPAQTQHEEKKPSKKLQRPRRSSLFSSSTSHLPISQAPVPPSPQPMQPTHTSQVHDVTQPSPSQPHPNGHPAPPPTRPPRNPARTSTDTHSSGARPSSSSGGRDYKALWDPAQQTSPLLSKFVRRHKSISTNANGTVNGNGRSASATPGSLLTRAGREERREREKEKEREKDKDKGKGRKEDTSPVSVRKQRRDTDGTRPSTADRNSMALAHALNTYAFASASLTTKASSNSLASSSNKRTSSKSNSKSPESSRSPRVTQSLSLSPARILDPLQQPLTPRPTPPIHTSSRESFVSTPSSTSTSTQPAKPAKGKGKERAGPNFSTLDRTILEELKLALTARESQFVYKGLGSGGGMGNGAMGGRGERHHPYPKEEVPYPRSYERGVVDLDVWETKWCQQLCGSLTWHIFNKAPPTKVLDLGCGTGTWILEAAKEWKHCQFVGLDLVPLQPDLQQVGSSNMASRVSWVQSNFLEGLPFPNDEFDFVHVKRIGRAVPEDKWDDLFEEIVRVMKPGASFEMMEEDLYFPGKRREPEAEFMEWEKSSTSGSNSGSKPSSPHIKSADLPAARTESTPTPRPTARTSNSSQRSRQTPVEKLASSPTLPTARRDSSPKSLFHPPPNLSKSSNPPTPATPTKTSPRPPPLSIATMLSGPSAAISETVAEGKINNPRTSSSTIRDSDPTSNGHSTFAPSSPTTTAVTTPPFTPHTASFSTPPLVRTVQKAPLNPRDHTVLETIYTEMHAKRFINLAPLSVVANGLSVWFKDVRTHPPLIFTFPPPPVHPRVRSTPEPAPTSPPNVASDEESGMSDVEHSPVRTSTTQFRKTHNAEDSQTTIRRRPSPNDEADSHIVTTQGLLLDTTPYAYLDDARFAAFSPSAKATFSSLKAEKASIEAMLAVYSTGIPPPTPPNFPTEGHSSAAPDSHAVMKALASLEGLPLPSKEAPLPEAESALARMQQLAAALATFKSRLPNRTLRVDLRTLNFHLALRTSDIIACSEAMWEWVLEFQEIKIKEKQNGRSRSGSVNGLNGSAPVPRDSHPPDPVKKAIEDLTRADFDGLLTQFNLDMRDQFDIGSALQERYAWNSVPMPAPQDRKQFDTACDKWDQYQHQQKLDQAAEAQQHHQYRRRSRRHSQFLSEAAATINHLPTIPDTISMRNATVRPEMDFGEARPGVQQPRASRMSISNGRTGRRSISRSRSHADLGKDVDQVEEIGNDSPHPSHLLARTMRVFVAWKA